MIEDEDVTNVLVSVCVYLFCANTDHTAYGLLSLFGVVWYACLLPPDIVLMLLFLLSSGFLLALLLQYHRVNTVLQQPTCVSVWSELTDSQHPMPNRYHIYFGKKCFQPYSLLPYPICLGYFLLFSVCTLLSFKSNRRTVFPLSNRGSFSSAMF